MFGMTLQTLELEALLKNKWLSLSDEYKVKEADDENTDSNGSGNNDRDGASDDDDAEEEEEENDDKESKEDGNDEKAEDHSLDEHYKLFLLPYEKNNNNNDVGELVRLDLDNNNWVYTNLDIVGTCNGLFCLYLEEETKYGNFYVWNPVTRQCREIENPDGEAFALDYGFGYASSIDDYKIVALFSPRKHGFGDLYVFSLRTGKWKRIDGLDGFYAALSLDDGTVVINDTLYWPLKNLKDWQKAKCIVGFNLIEEKLKEIPWMKWFSQYNRADFFGMKGCLSLHCYGEQGSDVWVLKQYGDWNSWEKMFSVNLGGMVLLDFADTGKCLVQTAAELKVIDPSRDPPEELQGGTHFSGRVTGSGVYVESFISPFVPLPDSKAGSSNLGGS
ncbi:hypothetical protein KSS87_004653 [Heliosperma pusillum]|nr:hypothetical protein KSS87_004653 [Heliosperma pusillum]